nr:MAG TPA: hypothetical protein [Caudoviricetes sp.]
MHKYSLIYVAWVFTHEIKLKPFNRSSEPFQTTC